MSKYVITGDCRGLNYYLQLRPTKHGHAPEFIWNGLQDNATKFHTRKIANEVIRELTPFVKLTMYIKDLSQAKDK